MKMKQQRHLITFLVLCFCIVSSSTSSVSIHKSNEVDRLNDFLKSKRLHDRFAKHSNGQRNFHEFPSSSSVYVRPQAGLAEGDKIRALPGQPEGVEFEQYSGYVTVDKEAGRALFYYFVESPQNSSTKPLVLWLNGGPGCSSFGNGAMKELGPFRVNSDGKTLFLNEYAWTNVANVIFLESPAGVGFSYSNRSSDYYVGDTRTAEDAYIFLVNWLERFPEYKTREFYITGESYAGHYVPQLANTILRYNNNTQTVINLKGIAIGNALIDGPTRYGGIADFLWSHAMNSDETNKGLHKYCDFANETYSNKCDYFAQQSDDEIGNIYFYDIYAPLCFSTSSKNGSAGSVHDFDPCSDNYVYSYLNLHEVQTALHANYTTWESCSYVVDWDWDDSPDTILPIIENLMRNNITVWIYSGDTDRAIPVTSTRNAINSMKLPIKTSWRPWYTNKEVGGYVVGYEGLAFVTVRGAGHFVPSYQPERALTMFSSFLKGLLPPAANP